MIGRWTATALLACFAFAGSAGMVFSPMTHLSGGSDPTVSSAATLTHGERSADRNTRGPPPFRVLHGDATFVLPPHSYCYDNLCADGINEDPGSVGSPAMIFVHAAPSTWEELTVSQTEGADPGGPRQQAEVEAIGDGWWRVTPVGDAGLYRVSLFATGADGDMTADLLWTTPKVQPRS